MNPIVKIFGIIFILLFLSENGDCQWVIQNSGVSSDLYEVKFINRYTGWTLGGNGIILKTTDAGNNWINIPNPSISAGGILSGLCPVDSNVVYVSGGFEVILKTTNGGSNWIIIRNGPYGTGTGFRATYFLNKDTGWFCGSMRVLRTTNGGQTFDSTGIFWGSLSDIYFKDFNNGLICGDGVVFKTTDGGMNWFNTNVPTGGHYYQFQKLAVINSQYVWIAGNSSPVYYSSNFGGSWDSIGAINSYPPSVMYCISFANNLIGFVGGTYGYLYKTFDGGHTWNREGTGPDQRFWGAMYCYNDMIVWGVGGAGKIMYTTTGGTTFAGNTGSEIPEGFNLNQNYPNPFNAVTTIEYEINKSGNYKLEVYNVLGEKVMTLFNKKISSGKYSHRVDASGLSSGVYFYRLSSADNSATRKLLLLK